MNNKLTKEQINKLPLIFYSGPVQIINSKDEFHAAMDELNNEEFLGFDTETRPSFKKKVINSVSLVQISASTKTYLFRITNIGLPERLGRLFEDRNVLKIGAGLRDDFTKLKKLRPFTPEGFLDLQDFVPDFGIEEISLQKMAAIVLGSKISKSQRLSNWDAPNLSEAQIRYASTDAWICREIYFKLTEEN